VGTNHKFSPPKGKGNYTSDAVSKKDVALKQTIKVEVLKSQAPKLKTNTSHPKRINGHIQDR